MDCICFAVCSADYWFRDERQHEQLRFKNDEITGQPRD